MDIVLEFEGATEMLAGYAPDSDRSSGQEPRSASQEAEAPQGGQPMHEGNGGDDMDIPHDVGAQMSVNGETFAIKLADNATAEAFSGMLPLRVRLSELNGNEKYVNLDQSLPTDPAVPSGIEAGDVMLFGNSCLVVFYESFSTTYSYTRIGSIEDASGLRRSLGPGSVEATFS